MNNLLLLLSKQKESYSSCNQVQHVLKTFTLYNIRNCLGHLVINNASINNMLINYISTNLKNKNIAYNAHQYRLKFNSNIINLTIGVFFFGKHT